jgi:hypothetical protein
MAEILVDFDVRVEGPDGRAYEPQACGRVRPDGLWEGWIEFAAPGHSLRTRRETTQPNRNDLMYWAEGLTQTYLEGALSRALTDEALPAHKAARASEATFDGPAPERRART